MNYMKEWKTLTDLTLEDALRKLMDVLPPDAYKAVPGGADLTDINPAYLTQIATEAFGPCGIGWSFNYNPTDVVFRHEARKKENRPDRTVHIATILHLRLTVQYVTPDGIITSQPIVANGSSENDNEGYALRGALTNAIGAAFSKMCWQLLVYQGKIDHHNAKTAWEKRNGGSKEQSGSGTETKADATTESNGAAEQKPKAEKAKTTPKAEPKSNGAKEQASSKMSVDAALEMVIPDGLGVPLSGKTLGVAKNNAMLGDAILKYLAGQQPKADGAMFTPANDEQTKLQTAALAILEAN